MIKQMEITSDELNQGMSSKTWLKECCNMMVNKLWPEMPTLANVAKVTITIEVEEKVNGIQAT
jgi:hypothetical protein